MNWSAEYWLNCDAATLNGNSPEGCFMQCGPALSKDECLKGAKAEGWLIQSRKAFCPHCKHLASHAGGPRARRVA